MPGHTCAQMMTASSPAAYDAHFGPSFYSPYIAAAQTALLMLEDTRRRLRQRYGADCVHALRYRLKSPDSIREKLHRKGLPVSCAAATALHDVAGLRAVLSDEKSVYRFAQALRQTSLCEFTGVHDYIASPKPSGYRSLHLLTRIPVYLQGQACMIPAEIQLRTGAMDVWASIEHEICYKPAVSIARSHS